PGLWPDRADDGLCHWPCFRMPPEPCGNRGAVGRRTLPGVRACALHHRAGAGGDHCRVRAVADRQRAARFHSGPQWTGGERLWRAFAGGYSLTSGLVSEIVLTFGFLIIILGATDARAPVGFAPIAVGLA